MRFGRLYTGRPWGRAAVTLLGIFACLFADPARGDEEPATIENLKPVTEIARVDTSGKQPPEAAPDSRRLVPPLILLDGARQAPPVVTRRSRGISGIAINAIPLPESLDSYDVESLRAPAPTLSTGFGEPYTGPLLEDDLPDLSEEDEGAEDERGIFHRELFYRPHLPIDPQLVALQRLGQRLGFRQLRRFFRSDLRDQYEEDPTYDYYAYQSQREVISALGRYRYDNQDRYDGATVEEVRAAVLENDPDQVERDLVLLDWGPFRVDDRGNLRVNVKKLKDERKPRLELAPDETQSEPMFQGRTFRVRTDARFRPDVGALIDGEDFREVIGKTGVSLDVDFYSSVLHRRYMKAEIEATLDTDGETALFVNFVLYSK